MRTVKRGQLPPQKLYSGICGFCGSHVEGYESELYYNTNLVQFMLCCRGKPYSPCPTVGCKKQILMYEVSDGNES